MNTEHAIIPRDSVTWTPAIGAWPHDDGVRFRLWAPDSDTVDVVYDNLGAFVSRPLEPEGSGMFSGWVPGIKAGIEYQFRLDGDRVLPDPASRWQPEGVRGPSRVIDPNAFAWTDHQWKGVAMQDLVIYELHVGAFTECGTFAGVQSRLDYLQHLGITAIEIMPVAEFAGTRNWGYDGVFLFAPSHNYGHPDDLRRLVDAAHRAGIAVVLDVVYNHVGPEGACWSAYTPRYFTERHQTPWGPGVNLDGEDSRAVREFFLQNALHWIHEYHMDGLRLDATHALQDDSSLPFLAEVSAALHQAGGDRPVLVIAEDNRHLLKLVHPPARGGFGLDGMWADDFHHELRRMTAGDHEGYFSKYRGTSDGVAEMLAHGGRFDEEHGDLTPFVICLQNHDQVGNRAFGDRLHHQIDPAVYRAASALLLTAPETPLLFMGQEWAASSPFCFFTDHSDSIGRDVTKGRREEFAAFSAFRDREARDRIPDPQDAATFVSSRLRWPELRSDDHQRVFRLYQALLAVRRTYRAFDGSQTNDVTVMRLDAGTIALLRHPANVDPILVVARLAGSASVEVPISPEFAKYRWATVLTTEDAAFADAPRQIGVERRATCVQLAFARPGAVVLRGQESSNRVIE